jgi:hypothetical protein
MMIGQKLPQNGQMLLAPARDRVVVVAIGDRPAHRQQQQFGQRIGHAMRLARILDHRKMIEQHRQP